MRKLLLSGIRRYTHSVIFWIDIIITIGLAAACGYGARTYYINLYLILAELVTDAVLISWFVGRENEEGSFRNKVIAGHSKGSIFLSEMILGVAASFILNILFMAVFICFNGYLLGYAPTGICIRMLLGLFAASICISAIFVTLSCMISYRAVSITVNLILIAISLLVASSIQKVLSEPEYIPYNINEMWAGSENTEIDPGKELVTRNADYIEEPLRSVLTAVYRISPCANIVESFNLTYNWFGYELANRIDPFHEKGLTWETMTDFTVTDDANRSLNWDLLCTAIECIVVSCAGYLLFKKKELK